jgi:hypothetical protein
VRRVRATIVALESSITYVECVFMALVIQHALRMRHTVICGLPGYTVFFHTIMNSTIFGKENVVFSTALM